MTEIYDGMPQRGRVVCVHTGMVEATFEAVGCDAYLR